MNPLTLGRVARGGGSPPRVGSNALNALHSKAFRERSENFPAAQRRESIGIPSPTAGAVGHAYQNFFFLQIQRLRITIPTLTAIAAG